MREYLKGLKDGFRGFVTKKARGLLDEYINLGIAIEDIIGETNEEVEDIQEVLKVNEEELDLEPLHTFMSDYIGMIVIGIKGFSEDTILEDAEAVQCKVISACDMEEGSIVFELSGVNGKKVGQLKLSPSKHGSFAERESSDIPMYTSRYRIFFYGGEALEYLDTEKDGSIEFLGVQS